MLLNKVFTITINKDFKKVIIEGQNNLRAVHKCFEEISGYFIFFKGKNTKI